MRRFLVVAGLMSMLLVFLGSCVRPVDPVDSEYDYIDLGNFNTGLEINFSMQNEDGFHESPVHINKFTVIGKLIYRVENDSDSGASLYLKYEMLDNWRIKETRVSTALNDQSFPTKDGFIDPAQLSNVSEFDPAVSETEEIVIPLGILPEDSRGMYFAIVGYFERSSGGNSIQGYSFGPCVYFVPVRTNPNIELRPILKVDVEGEVNLSRVTDYDWEITKEASPEAINNLARGESATVEYILTAKRLLP
ncbi:MAG TPA: hypothetical protein PL103_07400, partial [Saccharofermentans sp.]|nr:hypothetical protein [Saccharofermentans sp.]